MSSRIRTGVVRLVVLIRVIRFILFILIAKLFSKSTAADWQQLDEIISDKHRYLIRSVQLGPLLGNSFGLSGVLLPHFGDFDVQKVLFIGRTHERL